MVWGSTWPAAKSPCTGTTSSPMRLMTSAYSKAPVRKRKVPSRAGAMNVRKKRPRQIIVMNALPTPE